MSQASTLLMTQFVTHDVKRFLLSKPKGLEWQPGQGIDVRIDDDGWQGKERPFTPTSLQDDRILELTIKEYPESDGVTVALHRLKPGANLRLGDPFGTILYRGPGTFVAAGTGVTPFLAILRQLARKGALGGQKLLLSNKSERDVICAEELKHYLRERCVFTYTREHELGHQGRRIDASFLSANVSDWQDYFYICGPDAFVRSISEHLLSLGVNSNQLVYEQ